MEQQHTIKVSSEVGDIESVILHSPGPEVENMTPETAERALYSDILNLQIASREYSQLYGVLKKHTHVHQVKNLLTDVLTIEKARNVFVHRICQTEPNFELRDQLTSMEPEQLSRLIIEGVPLTKDNLTKFLSKERYLLPPLHNFFFTRDSAVAINDKMLISIMANKVRERETLIMETIFQFHPQFGIQTLNPLDNPCFKREATIEGGDILVIKENIFLIGLGCRTNSQGIDFLLEQFRNTPGTHHLIVQELPSRPESFIHLDMIFTMLNTDECMIYEPIILDASKFSTVHLTVKDGNVQIRYVENILEALKSLGIDLKAYSCGGNRSMVYQEREQWHSGANFFALKPGKIMGYERNIHTLEELNRHGYEIIRAMDIIENKVDLDKTSKCVITIEGSELSRGGGGARCMTMPLKRKELT